MATCACCPLQSSRRDAENPPANPERTSVFILVPKSFQCMIDHDFDAQTVARCAHHAEHGSTNCCPAIFAAAAASQSWSDRLSSFVAIQCCLLACPFGGCGESRPDCVCTRPHLRPLDPRRAPCPSLDAPRFIKLQQVLPSASDDARN